MKDKQTTRQHVYKSCVPYTSGYCEVEVASTLGLDRASKSRAPAGPVLSTKWSCQSGPLGLKHADIHLTGSFVRLFDSFVRTSHEVKESGRKCFVHCSINFNTLS